MKKRRASGGGAPSSSKRARPSESGDEESAVVDFASYDERAGRGGRARAGTAGRRASAVRSAALNSMNVYAGGSRATGGKKTGVAPKTSSQGALGGFGGGAGFAAL